LEHFAFFLARVMKEGTNQKKLGGEEIQGEPMSNIKPRSSNKSKRPPAFGKQLVRKWLIVVGLGLQVNKPGRNVVPRRINIVVAIQPHLLRPPKFSPRKKNGDRQKIRWSWRVGDSVWGQLHSNGSSWVVAGSRGPCQIRTLAGERAGVDPASFGDGSVSGLA